MDIKNMAVLSNNMFFNRRHLRKVKGRYLYLKRRIQHSGTLVTKLSFLYDLLRLKH